MDFKARVQSDIQTGSADRDAQPDSFDVRRIRAGVEGYLWRDFEYEFEWELTDLRRPLRDGFVNWRRFRAVEVRAGRFKMPFGRDQLTSYSTLDFIERSRIGDELAPGREAGLMLHGRLFGRKLRYEAGVFRHDGDNARASGEIPTGAATSVARITVSPARLASMPLFRTLEIGAAATSGEGHAGRNSLRGRSAFRHTWFERVWVDGSRRRTGVELSWTPGPFSLQAEWIGSREGRRGQGAGGRDLPDLIGKGWYAGGTWVVTGEKKAGSVEARRAWGALELAARHEALRFESGGTEPPSRSHRAHTLVPTSDRASTYGINWYINRCVKAQMNFVREQVEDIDRSSPASRLTHSTILARLQFRM